MQRSLQVATPYPDPRRKVEANRTMRILIIEDDDETAAYLEKGLGEAGYVTDWADNGADGLFYASNEAYDVLVVDRMLPKLDGLSMIEAVRKEGIGTPVLIVSALDKVNDRVRGLRAGGDDYLTKPFSFAELLARIEALLRRRSYAPAESVLKVSGLEMDLLSRMVTREGQEITLQPREFKLLEYLMRHAGQVVSRTMLLEGVWDYHFSPRTNVVDVHISRLRQKIDKGFPRPLIHTVTGAGYCLRAAE